MAELKGGAERTYKPIHDLTIYQKFMLNTTTAAEVDICISTEIEISKK